MRLSIAALGLFLTACYSSGEGIAPPLNQIYFPVGLTTDCDARAGAPKGCQASHLYVASSDFDLQYKSGSLQVIDLVRIQQLVEGLYVPGDGEKANEQTREIACERIALGSPQTEAEQVMAPGLCRAVDLSKDERMPYTVGIGAFASDVILTSVLTPDLTGQKKRLLLPVRGEASLHWIDLGDNGKPECGQNESDASPICNRTHRVGTEPSANTRNIKMPSEPYGIAVSDAGDAIAVTHQTLGQLSLFHQDVNDWDDAGPKLESVTQLSSSMAVAIAAAPEPWYVRKQRKAWLDNPGDQPDPFPPSFLVGYANSPHVDLVRFYSDPSSPARPFLQPAATVPLRANSGGIVSRGITFDDTERRACDELECSEPPSERCKQCANDAVGVYVSNRTPASLLVGSTIPGTLDSSSRDVPQFIDVMPVPIGASRVFVGKILNDGKLETRVFVVCFDQRRIAIYDPKSNRIEGFIITGRGPHAMAFDFSDAPPRALAYVGHFTDSYIGVIQLDRSRLRTYGKIVLSLAERVAPRASK